MKQMMICGILMISVFLGSGAVAEDMREINAAAKAKKAAVIKEMEQEKEIARKEAQESRQRILSDRTALVSAIQALESETAALENENQRMTKELGERIAEEKQLSAQLSEADAVLGELTGVIRTSARDLEALLGQNLQTAFDPGQIQFLGSMLENSLFLNMTNVRKLVDLYFFEMQRSAEVRVSKSPFINSAGEEVIGDILVLGNFTAAYRLNGQTGFLDYSPQDRRLTALPREPGGRVKKDIKNYISGKSMHVPIDVSRGGALRQLVYKTSLLDKIPAGGPIVWPILAVFALAVLIIAERFWFLNRHKTDSGTFMKRIGEMAEQESWGECREFCEKQHRNPLAKAILAGMAFLHMKREDMENAMQESLLREIPPLERYLSTLGMLAAIAPLLGLLGTVTGMINTFHVITYFGAGDPRMMSGGISEALVTTMLGLMAAIPIMFAHTLLSRKVENTIGQMEEKSISFINTVFKVRSRK